MTVASGIVHDSDVVDDFDEATVRTPACREIVVLAVEAKSVIKATDRPKLI